MRPIALEFIEQARVVGRVAYHAYAHMVLGRRAQQAGSADVDVLDGFGQRAIGFGDGLAKRVQVDDDEIDVVYAVRGERRVIDAGAREDAAMDARMQGLHATVHHLDLAGVRRYVHHLDAGLAQAGGRATGGQDAETVADEATRKLIEALFV
jgi:hypothetical protein